MISWSILVCIIPVPGFAVIQRAEGRMFVPALSFYKMTPKLHLILLRSMFHDSKAYWYPHRGRRRPGT